MAIADGRLVTWYYPNAVAIDRDLLALASTSRDAQEFGKVGTSDRHLPLSLQFRSMVVHAVVVRVSREKLDLRGPLPLFLVFPRSICYFFLSLLIFVMCPSCRLMPCTPSINYEVILNHEIARIIIADPVVLSAKTQLAAEDAASIYRLNNNFSSTFISAQQVSQLFRQKCDRYRRIGRANIDGLRPTVSHALKMFRNDIHPLPMLGKGWLQHPVSMQK